MGGNGISAEGTERRCNHEIWAVCPVCGFEYDRRVWGDTCPKCARETMKRIKEGVMRDVDCFVPRNDAKRQRKGQRP